MARLKQRGWLALGAVLLTCAGLAFWQWQRSDGSAPDVVSQPSARPEAPSVDAAGPRPDGDTAETNEPAGREATAATGCDIEYAGYQHDARRPLVLLGLPAEPLANDARYTSLEDRAGDLHAEVVRELVRRHGIGLPGAARLVADAQGRASPRGLTPGTWLFAILEPVERVDCFETSVEVGRVHRVRRGWPAAAPRLQVRGRVRDGTSSLPIAGARAGVHATLAEWQEVLDGVPAADSATTDTAGLFTLDLVLTMDQRSFYLRVDHADYLTGHGLLLPSAFQAGATEVEIDLDLIDASRAATLLGEVTDASGSPLSAELRPSGPTRSTPHWIAMSSGLPVRGKTDAAGRFELRRLPPLPLQLLVDARGYRPHRLDVALAAGERRVLPRIVLAPLEASSPATGTLRVSVLDDELQPVRAAVEVRIVRATEPARRLRARADGSARFADLPAGEYRVAIEHGGYGAVDMVAVAADRETALDHVVPKGSHFVGGVVVADGQPLAGVRVQVGLAGERSGGATRTLRQLRTRSDARGRFRLDGLPADRADLLLSMENPYVDRVVEAVALNRDDHRLEFPVAKRVTVTGTVRDGGGTPIAGARVEANPGPATRTGAAGDFALSVPATSNQAVLVTASHDGCHPVTRYLVLGDVGPDLALRFDAVLHRVHELARLRGTVTGADGQAVGGVRCTAVTLTGERSTLRASCDSDSLGRFDLASIVPGEVDVTFEHASHQRWRRTMSLRLSAVEEIAVRLEALDVADVRLELRTAQGAPAAGAGLDVRASHPQRHAAGKTGRDGSFVLSQWPIVATDVHVSQPGTPGHRFRLEPDRLRAAAVDLTLLAGSASLSGVVKGQTGSPLAGVQVYLEGRDALASISTSTTTDEQGRFRFESLPDGSYAVDAEGFVRTRQVGRTGGEPLQLVFVR